MQYFSANIVAVFNSSDEFVEMTHMDIVGEYVDLPDGKTAYKVYDLYPDSVSECPHNFYYQRDGLPILTTDDSGQKKAIYPLRFYEKEGDALETARVTTLQQLREQRSVLLTECDYIVVKAYEESTDIPAEWKLYRQQLRDLPATANVFNIIWPTLPE